MHPTRPQIGAAIASETGWQAELVQGYRNPAELLDALGLRPDDWNLAASDTATDGSVAFPLRVPRGFVARMRPGDPRDPLLLQVLPTLAEAVPTAGFVSDPVGDLASARTPGLRRSLSLLLSPEALVALSRALFAAGVMPYYLHQLDPIAGAGHFAVSDAHAVELVAAVSMALPGYLVPRLVRETAGARSKTPLGFFGAT